MRRRWLSLEAILRVRINRDIHVIEPGVRAALLAAMHDPAFLAEAATAQIDISPMSGQEVEAFIAQASRASPAIIERVKQAYAP